MESWMAGRAAAFEPISFVSKVRADQAAREESGKQDGNPGMSVNVADETHSALSASICARQTPIGHV